MLSNLKQAVDALRAKQPGSYLTASITVNEKPLVLYALRTKDDVFVLELTPDGATKLANDLLGCVKSS